MRRFALVLCGVLAAVPGAGRAEAPAPAPERPAWTAALYVDGYFVPGEKGSFIPTLFLDRDALHLEARWNYEDVDALSLWGGWGFTFGGEERYAKLTPMVGVVAGSTSGVAPGLELDARWGRVTYWLEAEYVVDVNDSAASWLYTWSELYVNVAPWLWVGASAQRMKIVESPNELDVGPMIGAGNPGPHGWYVSGYAYGLTRSSPTWLVTGALLF